MFEKIKEVLVSRENLFNSPHFQQGVKNFQEGKIKPNGIPIIWVKKPVSVGDWNGWYSKNNSYCKLSEEGVGKYKKIIVGFSMPKCNFKSPECEILTNEEMYEVDCYMRARNILPTPLEIKPN